MKYYYTEVVVSPESGYRDPAKLDNGELVSAIGDLVGGVKVLTLDESIPVNGRYVLACPDNQTQQADWDEKTAAEVNIDYPGLVGG
jgi:hypothetical protein